MNSTLKNILSFLSRVGLSAALLWYLSTKIDLQKTLETVKSARWDYLCLAFAVFFVTNIIILGRWFVFIRALDLKVPGRQVVRYFFIGLFGNLFLPSAIGGDVIKILGLCQNSAHKPKVVASVLLDRLSGFAGIVIVAVFSFVLGYQLISERSLMISIGVLAVGSVVVGTVLFHERIYSFCCRVFNFFPKLKNGLMTMHHDISLLKNKKKEGIKAIALSVLAQVVFAISFYLTAKALNQEIHLAYFFIFVPLLCVASSMPSIGGLGVREAGAAYLFAKVGVDSGVAVSMSLLNFLYMVIVGVLGGVIYVATLSSGRVQHRQPIADAGERNLAG